MLYGPVTSLLQSITDATVSKYFYNTKGFVHTVVILTIFTEQLLPECQFRNFVGHTGAY